MILEICVDSAAGLAAAIEGGADRIELCSALGLGGLTPTPGLIELARAAPVPVYAMIRPHARDFVFDAPDLASMRADIDAVRAAGLAGVVLGASRPDGRLDGDVLAALVAHAAGLGLTLHRAFDLVPDFAEALDLAVSLGFERILTAGGGRSAPENIETLRAIVEAADGRIAIMPGSGVRPQNVRELLAALPVREVHSSGSQPKSPASGKAAELGFATPGQSITDAGVVAALKREIAAVRR